MANLLRMYYELTDRFEVPSSLEQTWAFFSDATNLPRITPPWLNFSVSTNSATEIKLDSILDYTIRWKGLPIHWRTRIIDYSPPRQFIDLQIRGPYALWHHQHTFESDATGGVICADRVIYKIPLGPIGRMMHALTVRNQLLDIFRFRRRVIGESLSGLRALQDDVRIQVLS
ncbi:MAG: SRPBCC family protein [Anaerolineae bacterium]|nr:SRPBCC family protein [Phycisphaerae bacterium]